MKKILIFILKFYQVLLSPLKKPCCRFFPTCSNYALQAVERFGVIKGLYLTLKRLIRCNPFFKGGYDPVPKKEDFHILD